MNQGFRVVAAASLAAVLVAGTAYAHPSTVARGARSNAEGQGAPGGFRGRGPGGPGRFGVMLPLGQLELTDAQRQQIRQLLERHQSELQNEVNALLTPEQQERLAQLGRERQARMEQRRQRMQERRQQRQQQRPPA